MADMPILVILSGEAPLHVPLNYAESWRGVSKRHGSVSSSGSGGKASGGSVKKPCSRRRAVSRVPPDSGTSGNGLTEPGSGGSKLALQRKWGEQLLYLMMCFKPFHFQDGRAEAYSGMGGDASGGSVEGGHALINIGSGRSSAPLNLLHDSDWASRPRERRSRWRCQLWDCLCERVWS